MADTTISAPAAGFTVAQEMRLHATSVLAPALHQRFADVPSTSFATEVQAYLDAAERVTKFLLTGATSAE